MSAPRTAREFEKQQEAYWRSRVEKLYRAHPERFTPSPFYELGCLGSFVPGLLVVGLMFASTPSGQSSCQLPVVSYQSPIPIPFSQAAEVRPPVSAATLNHSAKLPIARRMARWVAGNLKQNAAKMAALPEAVNAGDGGLPPMATPDRAKILQEGDAANVNSACVSRVAAYIAECNPRVDSLALARMFVAAEAPGGMDALMMACLARYESGFDTGCTGGAGERGLLQVHPCHRRAMREAGLDFASERDRLAFAQNLYKARGLRPWTVRRRALRDYRSLQHRFAPGE
jgi:hypothetical protein